MSDTVTKLWAHPQRDQILQFAGFLADPITRRTMAKLTIHSSMSVNDIDTKSLRATRAEVVTRLVKIERNGLATSKKNLKGRHVSQAVYDYQIWKKTGFQVHEPRIKRV